MVIVDFTKASDIEMNGQYCLFYHSTTLLVGNLVDGSPPVRHTEADEAPMGGLGPAPIQAQNLCKLKIEGKCG